jgi:hypothetical protein
MTMPPDDGTTGLLGQILAKQGEMSVQLAVISKTLEQIPDHETRLRALERGRWPLPSVAVLVSAVALWLAYAHH